MVLGCPTPALQRSQAALTLAHEVNNTRTHWRGRSMRLLGFPAAMAGKGKRHASLQTKRLPWRTRKTFLTGWRWDYRGEVEA